jgi:hypothetical protein
MVVNENYGVFEEIGFRNISLSLVVTVRVGTDTGPTIILRSLRFLLLILLPPFCLSL